MIEIPQKILQNPILNKRLVDALEQLKQQHVEIKVIEEYPTSLTEIPVILYHRGDKKVLICDTTEWRSIATEEFTL